MRNQNNQLLHKLHCSGFIQRSVWDLLPFLASDKIFFWIKAYTEHFLQ